MRPISILAVCLALVVQEFNALAQVPHVMTYQGRVASGGTNFSGTGQFKFALVSGGTSAAAQASASATVSFGFVVQIAITSGGAGYTAAPAVTITDSSGSGAVAVAQIANGQVVSITVTDAGSGYSASPTITIAPPAMNLSYTTYWSHDGTSSAGGEPASAVPVSVSQGLFTVGLGDTLIPNMGALAPQALANADVRLRLWFNDGVSGFSQLSPDQRLTSAAYAMMADTVRDGAITAAKLAPSSISAAQIAPGSITANQLADGAVTSAKLGANVALGPPRGSVLMSTNANDTNLMAAGYVRIPGARVQSDEWEALRSTTTIPPRTRHSAVWTGTEMIVWGGYHPAGGYRYDGGRYNLASNSWTPLPTNGAPYAGGLTKAIWTGTELIVWGGDSQGVGGIYNLQSNAWRRINPQNAPTPNYSYDRIYWTGAEMLVWGLNSGGRFNPVTGLWSPISQIGAPSGQFAGAWTGTELLVWQYNEVFGARYSPAANVWLPLPIENGPTIGDMGFWTGSEFVVFPQDKSHPGAKYDPEANVWRSLAPSPYYINLCGSPIWTGSKFIFGPRGDGDDIYIRLFDIEQDNWSAVSVFNGPNLDGECSATSFWNGQDLVLYGDSTGQVYRWRPAPPQYLYQKQ